MEQQPPSSFPMTLEGAETAPIQLFDVNEKGVEGIGYAYDNLDREALGEFAGAISKNALQRIVEDNFLSATEMRRLEAYALLPYSLEAALELSDEYGRSAGIDREKRFVEAGVEALVTLALKVGKEKPPKEMINELARSFIADWASAELEYEATAKVNTRDAGVPAQEPANEAEEEAQGTDIEKLLSSPPVPHSLIGGQEPENPMSSHYRPDYEPKPSTLAKLDGKYLSPLARNIKSVNPHLDKLLDNLRGSPEELKTLKAVVQKALGPLEPEDLVTLFRERADSYEDMVEFIEQGGDKRSIMAGLDTRSEEVYRTHVNYVNATWGKIPSIAYRAGFI